MGMVVPHGCGHDGQDNSEVVEEEQVVSRYDVSIISELMIDRVLVMDLLKLNMMFPREVIPQVLRKLSIPLYLALKLKH